MKFKNDLILRAAFGREVERTPVWLMRQAGRVLPEYRAVRAKAGGFLEMVKTPELAAEVTIQPVDILKVDAAIIFSDILVLPEAMGLPYQIVETKGPWFDRTISSKNDISRLADADTSGYGYVLEAIQLTKKKLNNEVPLIGFAGAPWTILSYMIEGKGSKTFSKAKKFLYSEPVLSHKLLEKIAASTINYLKDQVKAGADLLQIFDSWAGVLSPEQYSAFGLSYIETICKELQHTFPAVPIIVFAKGAYFARKEMNELSCRVVGLDWNMGIEESRIQMPGKTLQGNMDPCLLYADDLAIIKATQTMLSRFGPHKHIANLGHGLYPDIEKEKVKLFIHSIREYKHPK